MLGAALLGPPAAAQEPRYDLVPWPAEVVPWHGRFAVTARTPVVALGRHRDLARLAALAQDVVEEAAGVRPRLARRDTAGAIVLALDSTADTTTGAYVLAASPEALRISAATPAGLFYGLQTLRQLITRGAAGAAVPAVHVSDRPRFTWRGMHLDVGRHLYPVAFIKRYIDLLARYKLNTFHWHLSEDQGWRLEIRRWPRLTTVGACRRETIVAKNFEPFVGDGRPYCGFYTQREVREIVAYAAERYVTIVPEIDMPGHMLAALAAYPDLACTPGPFEVGTRWGVFDDILCPGEGTFTFVEQVLREVMDLFPSRFIHIGGDEAPKVRWRVSALVQDIMRRENLANEEAVQGWFNRRVERMLNARGRRLIGWDEILEGGLAPDATVMSWRGTAGGIEAARQGHDVVMTPGSHLYFDHYEGDARFEPLAIGGFTPLERVYAYEPVPTELTPAEAAHILGAQANVWTEYLPTAAAVEYMALPRMLALAEVVWSPAAARSWEAFQARLPARLAELDRLGVGYRIPHVVGLDEDRLTLADTVTVALTSPIPGAVIRYTIDGSDPLGAEVVWRYTEPFRLSATDSGVMVTARAFLPNGRSSPPRAARFTRARLRAPDVAGPAGLVRGVRAALAAGRFGSVTDLDTVPGGRDTTLDDVGIPAWAPAEDYGVRFTGFACVSVDGIYRFRLTSDDGSALRVGATRVVDNDGLHGAEERAGSVALRAGCHALRLDYFQRGGGRALGLLVERDDGTARALPAAVYRVR